MFSIGQISPTENGELLLVDEGSGNYASFLFRKGVLIGSILLGDASLATKVKSAVEAQEDFSAQLGQGISAAAFKEALKA